MQKTNIYLTRLYNCYAEKLLEKALEITDNYSDAEDVVQMCFEWAERRLRKEKITYKHLLVMCKYAAKSLKNYNDDKAENIVPATIVYKDPQEVYLQMDKLENMFDCLMRIKDTYRHVLIMYIVYGLTGAEIAKKLNMKSNTVNKKIARGKCLFENVLMEKGYM